MYIMFILAKSCFNYTDSIVGERCAKLYNNNSVFCGSMCINESVSQSVKNDSMQATISSLILL